ncbi:NADH-quinone oxidoreductase subunit N [soil metagenome]
MLPDASLLQSLQDQLGRDLLAFAPELFLATAIVFILFARLFSFLDSVHRVTTGITVVFAALGLLLMQWDTATEGITHGNAFSGLLVFDTFALWFRTFILLATLIVLLLSRGTGLPDHDDSGDFTVMLLGSALGLMLMSSANHLLIVFLAIEMASLPSYALSGFLKGRLTGSEAALKYVIFGAASGGIMLYGISLLTARVGTGYLPALAKTLGVSVAHGGFDFHLMAGLLFLGVGLGYKLSVVPMHVWLPDVFEGAAAEVGAYLSVASKAAAVALLGRLLEITYSISPDHAYVVNSLGLPLAVIGAITATYGNLMAYAQTNLNRLLGYSTIAHAGFLLAGLATITKAGTTATLVYLNAYLFANLAAFAVVAAVRVRTGREDVNALKGLVKESPLLGIGFALAVMSLLGLPPLAGFAGKFLIFESLFESARGEWSSVWWSVFALLLVNTAVSAGYYLKLIRLVGLEDAETPAERNEVFGLRVLVVVLSLASVLFGVLWSPLLKVAAMAVGSLR